MKFKATQTAWYDMKYLQKGMEFEAPDDFEAPWAEPVETTKRVDRFAEHIKPPSNAQGETPKEVEEENSEDSDSEEKTSEEENSEDSDSEEETSEEEAPPKQTPKPRVTIKPRAKPGTKAKPA